MRPRNQAERRRQLTNAGRHVLLERGAVGVRVKDIAERAGITPSSVLYYYPRIDELMMEVSREAMERYAERRSRQVRALDDPARQLRLDDPSRRADRTGRRGQPPALRARCLHRVEPGVPGAELVVLRQAGAALPARARVRRGAVACSGSAPTQIPWRAASWRWRTALGSRWWWATPASTARRPSGSCCATRARSPAPSSKRSASDHVVVA